MRSTRTIMRYTVFATALIIVSCTAQDRPEQQVGEQGLPGSDTPRTEAVTDITSKHGFASGLLDKDGVLWFGTLGSGVFRYDGSAFNQLTARDGLCNAKVHDTVQDQDGVLWFGTAKGLCRYNGRAFTAIPLPFKDTTGGWLDEMYPMIDPNAVHALEMDTNGDLWIGTAGGGAYRYSGKAFTSYLTEIGTKQSDGRTYNWIPCIEADQKGHLWFASMTHGGAMRYADGVFTQFLVKDGLSEDMVRTIYTDRSGTVWFGFNGNRASGLTMYKEGAFTTYSTADGLCDPSIHALLMDATGRLWIGSGRGGLCVFDGTTFTEVQLADGVPFGHVQFIVEDRAGAIWIGGGAGLWRIVNGSVEGMILVE